MKTRWASITRNVLAVWGAASLLFLVAITFWIFTPWSDVRLDRATREDVRFVVNWTELGEQRVERVLRSYQSARHFTGDHFDAFAIRLNSLSAPELASNPRWVRGDRADDVIKKAVEFVTSTPAELNWLPSGEAFLTEGYYIWRGRVELNGDDVTAAAVIFAHPASQTVFYVSSEV
jgi:hypothetical protein